MIHFGQMRCGKVDRCGELFHVVTEFIHANFIPLVPLRSLLVLEGPSQAKPLPELRLPLSPKSVLMAWVRTVLVLLILFNSFVVLNNLTKRLLNRPPRLAPVAAKREWTRQAVVNPLALVAACAIFFGLTYRFGRPRWSRAVELADLLGLSEEELEAHLASGASLASGACERPGDSPPDTCDSHPG